jgi:hypothetical protein
VAVPSEVSAAILGQQGITNVLDKLGMRIALDVYVASSLPRTSIEYCIHILDAQAILLLLRGHLTM